MKTVRIIASVLDTSKLTIYLQDGKTIDIPQGDPRISQILDVSSDQIMEKGYADISSELLVEKDSETDVMREFEKLVKGAIKFFRVHQNEIQNLSKIFTDNTETETLTPRVVGVVPEADKTTFVEVSDLIKSLKKLTQKEAINDIMANAKSVNDADFSSSDNTDQHTMVAVVDDALLVPGMEHLKLQLANAVALGSPEGATNFIRRLSAVIENRKHTIDELLNFMSRGDLPIADDGSIIAYKVLKTRPDLNKSEDIYYDCYTGNVPQRIGSYVTQKNVDENRRTQCSTGLHIARRGYLGGFSGDIITLVKINPEDVIAVPQDEPDKMRARGYHIIFNIPQKEHLNLRNNQPFQFDESKKILTLAIKGDHIGIIENVEINGIIGSDVKVTSVEDVKNTNKKQTKTKKATPKSESIDLDPKKPSGPKVDVKTVNKKIVSNKNNQKTPQRILFDDEKFNDLYDLKKKRKISWTKLGFNQTQINKILSNNSGSDPKPAVKPAVKAVFKITAKKTTKVSEKPVKVPTKEPIKKSSSKNMTKAEKAQELVKSINTLKTQTAIKKAYNELLQIKKSAKVSWEKLGINTISEIEAKIKNL